MNIHVNNDYVIKDILIMQSSSCTQAYTRNQVGDLIMKTH